MKRRLMYFGATTLMAASLALASPQDANQAPAPDQGHAGHRAPDPNRQVKMLTKRLNLSSDQQQQVLPLLEARQQQFESIRSDNSLATADRHDKMRAVREDTDNKIKAILNDNQKQQYDQMQQHMRERMQQHRDQQQQQQQQPQDQQQQNPQ